MYEWDLDITCWVSRNKRYPPLEVWINSHQFDVEGVNCQVVEIEGEIMWKSNKKGQMKKKKFIYFIGIEKTKQNKERGEIRNERVGIKVDSMHNVENGKGTKQKDLDHSLFFLSIWQIVTCKFVNNRQRQVKVRRNWWIQCFMKKGQGYESFIILHEKKKVWIESNY